MIFQRRNNGIGIGRIRYWHFERTQLMKTTIEWVIGIKKIEEDDRKKKIGEDNQRNDRRTNKKESSYWYSLIHKSMRDKLCVGLTNNEQISYNTYTIVERVMNSNIKI